MATGTVSVFHWNSTFGEIFVKVSIPQTLPVKKYVFCRSTRPTRFELISGSNQTKYGGRVNVLIHIFCFHFRSVMSVFEGLIEKKRIHKKTSISFYSKLQTVYVQLFSKSVLRQSRYLIITLYQIRF